VIGRSAICSIETIFKIGTHCTCHAEPPSLAAYNLLVEPNPEFRQDFCKTVPLQDFLVCQIDTRRIDITGNDVLGTLEVNAIVRPSLTVRKDKCHGISTTASSPRAL
jgi:hypothetical protein